jgi:peptidoglycan hydrolase CwlO-like protein
MNLAIMIGLGSSFAIPSAKAETADSLSQVQQQRAEVQENIENADQEIQQVKEELGKLNEQIKRADQAIVDNKNKIEETKGKISSAETEISQTEAEIAALEEAIKNRTEILKQRAISYQHSGGNVEYIDVLLGSTSFSDFLNRAIAVGKIVEADRAILERQEADEASLQEKKASKVKTLADLTDMKTELEGMHAQILEQKEQNDQLREQLKNKETANIAAKKSLEQKAASLASQEANFVQAPSQEQPLQSTSVKAIKANTSRSSNTSKTSGPVSNTNKTSSPDSNSSKQTVAQTPVNPNGSVNDLIRAGYKYIGNSVYVFGGGRSSYDIANGRFDCSGYVIWAFSTVGVSLSGNTDSLKHAGTQVSSSNMQPGDLVFFNTYKTDGHVGIYVGGGKFIGSQSSTGVAIANMSSGYWADKFNGRVVRVNL